MKEKEDMIKLRDILRESADIIDEMLELTERAEQGESCQKDLEAATGRFLFKMMELQTIDSMGV